jgi:hypothetical protein
MGMKKMKIDVLGVKYTIRRVNFGQDAYMEKMQFGGYCDGGTKEIAILNLKTVPEWASEPEDIISTQEKETIRHELIHAFLNESGLRWNSFAPEKAWAKNEEMVDWFAIQMPRLIKAFKDADAL